MSSRSGGRRQNQTVGPIASRCLAVDVQIDVQKLKGRTGTQDDIVQGTEIEVGCRGTIPKQPAFEGHEFVSAIIAAGQVIQHYWKRFGRDFGQETESTQIDAQYRCRSLTHASINAQNGSVAPQNKHQIGLKIIQVRLSRKILANKFQPRIARDKCPDASRDLMHALAPAMPKKGETQARRFMRMRARVHVRLVIQIKRISVRGEPRRSCRWPSGHTGTIPQ